MQLIFRHTRVAMHVFLNPYSDESFYAVMSLNVIADQHMPVLI